MKPKKRFFTLKYFLCLITLSLLITGAAVFLANDAFAITGSDTEQVIRLDAQSSANKIASTLKKEGLIKSKTWFLTYLRLRGKALSVKPGVYRIPENSGFDGIHRILTYGNDAQTAQVRISIPEGATLGDIMRIICDENGICSRSDFEDTVKNGDFSKYSFLPADRTSLEGYLYPDTYFFYTSCSAYSVIDKMLGNFNAKFDEKYRQACKNAGISVDQAITLASIIIKEAKYVSDYGRVSSVLHNRLKSDAFAHKLQSDATLVYALGRPMNPSDKELDSPYNTYKYGKLPPTPICSPDLNAISYAIHPDKTDYFYFVADKNGAVLYARTYSAHLKNIEKTQKT